MYLNPTTAMVIQSVPSMAIESETVSVVLLTTGNSVQVSCDSMKMTAPDLVVAWVSMDDTAEWTQVSDSTDSTLHVAHATLPQVRCPFIKVWWPPFIECCDRVCAEAADGDSVPCLQAVGGLCEVNETIQEGGYIMLRNVTWSFADAAIPAGPGAYLAESVSAGSQFLGPTPAGSATIILNQKK